MPTWKTVLKIAATLPETVEGLQHGNPVLRVGGKVILSGGNDERFSIITEDREVLVASSPDIYIGNPHHDGSNWVAVRLTKISERELREIMTDAWRIRAPKALRETRPTI